LISSIAPDRSFPPVTPSTGFKLANDGQDTRAIQHYLGHKNIPHTVRYTELSSDRFKEFRDD
jgi:type 1 fimbriae regulatory protein FimB/type 1 fimbriae regulatory protein FimE